MEGEDEDGEEYWHGHDDIEEDVQDDDDEQE